MVPSDLIKTREICFDALPKGQVEQATRLLTGIEGLSARVCERNKNCVVVSYDIRQFTLESLESALIAQLFHLDNALLQKLKRALFHYTEQVQRENLLEPEQRQRSHQIFVQAWEHHPHGDHDDTPVEWREYR